MCVRIFPISVYVRLMDDYTGLILWYICTCSKYFVINYHPYMTKLCIHYHTYIQHPIPWAHLPIILLLPHKIPGVYDPLSDLEFPVTC